VTRVIRRECNLNSRARDPSDLNLPPPPQSAIPRGQTREDVQDVRVLSSLASLTRAGFAPR